MMTRPMTITPNCPARNPPGAWNAGRAHLSSP
jgi:hypothetical protein